MKFINNELLPELEKLESKYAVWWSFKPNSTLKKYLEEHQYYLTKYFTPSDLIDIVTDVLSNMTLAGNSDIIELNDELQIVFDSWVIYLPNLLQEHLMSHIVIAPLEISIQLTNENIANNLYIESPYDILYKDPSSVFWINPIVDFLINKSTGNIYSWKQILNTFTDFCTSNNEFFTRHSDYIISVNENTPLTKLFHFQYFHITQIETILRQITKFLGRQNGIFQSCAYLTYNYLFHTVNSTSKYTNVFTFIDDIINNNNAYLPLTRLYMHI